MDRCCLFRAEPRDQTSTHAGRFRASAHFKKTTDCGVYGCHIQLIAFGLGLQVMHYQANCLQEYPEGPF